MVKLIDAFPWLADTTVALEEVGFTDEQITRLLAEKRHNQAMSSFTQTASEKHADESRQTPEQPHMASSTDAM